MMSRRSLDKTGGKKLVTLSASISLFLLGQHATAMETPLYAFSGGADGGFPFSGVTISSGVLYGTAQVGGQFNGGVVFMLASPAGGGTPWVETPIHAFSGVNDGFGPEGALLADSAGALYGTTTSGGVYPAGTNPNAGTVFKLTPPAAAGGTWTETVLYSFTGAGGVGAYPASGVIADRAGALYGTTMSGNLTFGGKAPGTIFKLTPPAAPGGAWTETTLHKFTGTGGIQGGEVAGLVMDGAGALYGTTNGGGLGYGLVFKLTPPAPGRIAWGYKLLHKFTGFGAGSDGAYPNTGLILDASGALYGTTTEGGPNNLGVIFKLAPPPKGQPNVWKMTVLTGFGSYLNGNAPDGGLLMDSAGALYGTTYQGGPLLPTCPHGSDCGLVFKLTPPAAGGGAWTETVLHSFTGGGDGIWPSGSLVMDGAGVLYGTTGNGGGSLLNCPNNMFPSCGTVFGISP